jgi:hypothetical protein
VKTVVSKMTTNELELSKFGGSGEAFVGDLKIPSPPLAGGAGAACIRDDQ